MFPKMMVPTRSLPDCFKKRLEIGDASATVGTEFVSAKIVDWGKKILLRSSSNSSFEYGGDVEPCISTILFEKAIHFFESSSDTLLRSKC